MNGGPGHRASFARSLVVLSVALQLVSCGSSQHQEGSPGGGAVPVDSTDDDAAGRRAASELCERYPDDPERCAVREPANCNLQTPWVREGAEWGLEPKLRFRTDSSELVRESVDTLQLAVSRLSDGQQVRVFLDVHPDVMAHYSVMGRHLPRDRVRSLTEALAEWSAVVELRETVAGRPMGPPRIRFAFPDCPVN